MIAQFHFNIKKKNYSKYKFLNHVIKFKMLEQLYVLFTIIH